MHKHIMVKSPRHHNRYDHQEQEVELIYPKPKEKPLYQTIEIRFPPDEDHSLHPLRRQYLENRLKQIEIHERQQTMQDKFSTAMYGKKDYSEEKNNILQEMLQDKQSRPIGHQYPDEKFLDIADKQIAQEKYPHTPEAVGKAIARYERENPEEYQTYMEEMEEREKANKKTWQEINQDINNRQTSPARLTEGQWENILKRSAEDLHKVQRTGKSYCNIYTRDRLLNQGVYMPPDQNANAIKDYMDQNPQNWEKIPKKTDAQGNPTGHLDHQAAHEAAANGDAVVVVWKNPNPNKHGHIAQVDGTADMQKSRTWGNAQVPTIDGYNSSAEEIKTESLSWQFTPGTEPNMDYYRYVGEKRNEKLAS